MTGWSSSCRRTSEEAPEQLTLFLGKYSYQVIVTNLRINPLNVWKFYNARAGIELIIKELKGDYPLAKIPTRYFAANEAYFHLQLFAYNLVNWFKRLCLPKEFQKMTLKSLRTQILLVPGELIRAGNKPTLKFPVNYWHRDVIEHALNMRLSRSTRSNYEIFTPDSGLLADSRNSVTDISKP